ncbi:MAG TPA: RNA polymerase sigma factor SigJ [Vicinamibacterales bacterium]|jgi:RNA polymerase sigma-70 factor (ECF subfamily)
MDERELTERFQEHRSHLRAVAYRMLGSVTEADDALQEGWLRIHDQDAASIENMRAWLTTVVGRVCLNMLRSRRVRGEKLPGVHVPDPVVTLSDAANPEQEALVADSVGLALLVVLEALTPAERLAFVLHDVFGVSFAEVAAILERSEGAAMQLASRARRRVRDSPEPDRDRARQRSVVDAFFAAARDGDFASLVHILHPDVVLRVDGGRLRRGASLVLHGAEAVAAHTTTYAKLNPYVVPVLVNGTAGAVIAPPGEPYAVMAFIVTNEKIAAIDALLDPERLRQLDLPTRQPAKA